MERTVSRRVFVGSAAAGIPLIVGTAGHAVARSTTGPHIHGADGAADAVFEHATSHLAAIVNRIGRNGASAEDARVAGAYFSALSVYTRQAGLGLQTRDAVRDLIRAKGREAVLDLTLDRARVSTQLTNYGVTLDERWLTTLHPDRSARTKALEELSREGITGMLSRVAQHLEHVARELDRRGGHPAGIRLIQADDSWRADFCASLLLQVSIQAAHAAMLCAAMLFMPGMESECAFAQMAVQFYLAIYYAMCF